mgnify:CR=1 FL=1
MTEFPALAVVIPAAGIGKRMQANVAKQYLKIDELTILEHTINAFVDLPFVKTLVVTLAQNDDLFPTLGISTHEKVVVVPGGAERANSVFNGLNYLKNTNVDWVMVHDAARPCLRQNDIETLFSACLEQQCSGILASRVRDTMKRAKAASCDIAQTVDRDDLWHALTPQCSKVDNLHLALLQALDEDGDVAPEITDEASALELYGERVILVPGSVRNIKITHPEDLSLAKIFINSELS